MKSFLIAIVALVIISVGANQILTQGGWFSSAAETSSDNVRLSD